MSAITESISFAKNYIGIVRASANEIAKILRNHRDYHPNCPLPWNSRRNVARSLRYLLSLRMRWLTLRYQFMNAANKLSNTIGQAGRAFGNKSSELVVNYGYRVDKRRSDSFSATCLDEQDYQQIRSLVKDWNTITLWCDQLWNQTETLLRLPSYLPLPYNSDLPDRQGIKKYMPIGGRDAYSALLVCQHGSLSSNKPEEHKLFGWHTDSVNIANNLKAVIRAIDHRRAEKRSNVTERLTAPSFKRGVKLLGKKSLSNNKSTLYEGRLLNLYNSRINRIRLHAALLNTSYQREGTHLSAGLLRFTLHQIKTDNMRANDRAKQIVLRLMFGSRRRENLEQAEHQIESGLESLADYAYRNSQPCVNTVPTILTGGVYHLSGDDYYAPCVYQDRTGSLSHHKTGVVWGYILLRKGWPDVIHRSQLPILPTSAVDLDRCRELLDQSSRYFFSHNGELNSNKSIANVLRKLRNLPELTLQDSYDVSNCIPGTRDFVHRCSLKEEQGKVTGLDLAVRWRRAGYIQLSRLANVVNSLHEKQQQKLAAAAKEQQQAAVASAVNELYGLTAADSAALQAVASEDPALAHALTNI